ncbi:hypothetical protein [Vibrio agarivorans]|uniref:hypothetical protein n=1 Tax=Vibrio agarivorans TaxID=153622 RepID=UPI0025B4805F|nr:hypothetical protein [Vibrio agarivorans]MDN3661068.1 hypothetical protein [Vibrio agarivorans]
MLKKKTSAEKESSAKGSSNLLPISAIALSVMAMLGSGFSAKMAMNGDSNLRTLAGNVQSQLNSLEMGVEQASQTDPAQIEAITETVTKEVRGTIGTSVDTRINQIVSKKINDYDITVSDRLNRELANNSRSGSASENIYDENRIIDIIDSEIQKVNLKFTNYNTQTHNRIDSIEHDLVRQTHRIDDAYAMMNTGSKNQMGTIVPRIRLKEFNIVYPALKDGTLFVVDAPKKSGKDNSITLTIGEGFRSKHGSHKVEKAVKTADGYRLLISGGYYIDGKREEFTKAELKALQAKKAPSSSQKKATPATSSKPRTQNTSIKQAPAKQDNRLDLAGWYVVTTVPENQEVVVYNPETTSPMRLKENLFVSGVGKVQNIDFKTGRTCFEKYCIQGIGM